MTDAQETERAFTIGYIVAIKSAAEVVRKLARRGYDIAPGEVEMLADVLRDGPHERQVGEALNIWRKNQYRVAIASKQE
jgi:hypothetical protein